MIIVHQDKKAIYNFSNLTAIVVVPSFDEGYYLVRGNALSGIYTLGTYPNEKRAMDILDKIVTSAGLGMYVYAMPKK